LRGLRCAFASRRSGAHEIAGIRFSEHDQRGTTGEIEADFRDILKQLRYPFRRFPRVGFVFDSDENVQKNYEGSYFYRLR